MAKHGAETHHTLHLPSETWNGLLYSKGPEKSCREEHVPFSRTHLDAEAFIAIHRRTSYGIPFGKCCI